jgi:hypothetical protein
MVSAMTFEIDIEDDAEVGPDQPRGVSLRAGEIVLTRLIRPNLAEPDDFLRAPLGQLAFWLIDHWWRLRWEGIPPAGMTAEWKLAHEMASIGGGYIWPRLSIWGEDPRVGLISRSDPQGVVGPVRYLTDALVFISAAEFAAGVDDFLSRVAGDRRILCSDHEALLAQLRALQFEREDPDLTQWRRMEARLGYDVDEAPAALIDALGELAKRYGGASVEEAAMAAPGAESVLALSEEIGAAQRSKVTCDFRGFLDQFSGNAAPEQTTDLAPQQTAPWVAAERAAADLRRNAALPAGPLRNKVFADLISTRVDSFQALSSVGPELPYGLRLGAPGERWSRLALRSRWPRDRRFEVARALGDAIWDRGGPLGPLGASSTGRQKFQRAFAQSLLCPFDDLMAYLGDEEITDGAMSSAARHFHVSERLVRSVLVNKRRLPRHRLASAAASDIEPESLAEQLEAA